MENDFIKTNCTCGICGFEYLDKLGRVIQDDYEPICAACQRWACGYAAKLLDMGMYGDQQVTQP